MSQMLWGIFNSCVLESVLGRNPCLCMTTTCFPQIVGPHRSFILSFRTWVPPCPTPSSMSSLLGREVFLAVCPAAASQEDGFLSSSSPLTHCWLVIALPIAAVRLEVIEAGGKEKAHAHSKQKSRKKKKKTRQTPC